jgi:uncharacterized protein (DUF58 family)
MPRARFYGAVVLALVLFYYAGASQVAWLYLLAYWVGGLIVASFLYHLWNRGLGGRISVSGHEFGPGSPMHELPEPVLNARPAGRSFEGDTISIDLELSSTRGTRGPARLTGSLAGRQMTAAAGVIPKSGWAAPSVIAQARRGPIVSTNWILETGDLLGLFRNRAQKLQDREVALVLPRFTSLVSQPRVRELEAGSAVLRAGAGTELFGAREYRPGDPLRRIHWPSSARHGELIVREYEPPGVQSLGIFCDPAPPAPEAADQIARIAASEAWDCLRGGGRAILWSPGAEPSTFDESRSIWALLEWLARYPAPVEGLDLPPPRVSDAVAVLARDQPQVIDALEGVKQRGGSIRAWVVGDAEPDLDAPVRHTGLGWPL